MAPIPNVSTSGIWNSLAWGREQFFTHCCICSELGELSTIFLVFFFFFLVKTQSADKMQSSTFAFWLLSGSKFYVLFNYVLAEVNRPSRWWVYFLWIRGKPPFFHCFSYTGSDFFFFFNYSCPQFWILSYPITEQLNMTTQENSSPLFCVLGMLGFKLLKECLVLWRLQCSVSRDAGKGKRGEMSPYKQSSLVG